MNTPREQFDVLSEMEQMMDRMRRSMADGVSDVRSWRPARFAGTPGYARSMTLDHDGDDYRVLADLPGFEREEIDLRLDEGMLVLSAAHAVDTSDEHGAISQSRRVNESIRVPESVIAEDITATYRNGVLEVHLPVETDHSHSLDIHID